MLRPRRLLLVLDNCEHLIEACAELVDGLLQACSELRVMATSLQPLGATAETTWRVPPLSVPDAGEEAPEALQTSEAVQLFVARVQSHWPDFTFGEHNARPIAQICRRLDGLPLALELVAARVESLGIAEVATRIGRRFELATGSSSTAPARQRTLQAALDWSCGLLSEQELILLRRLGVFVGGWTLDAAEAVCSDEVLPQDGVIDTLSQLVTKSLVVADHDQLTVRYRLLETVRAHALTQLAGVGEARVLHRRHAEYIQKLTWTGPRLIDADVASLLTREQENVRAALEWTIQHDQPQLGLRIAIGAFSLWMYSGHYVEGNTWFERLLELPDAFQAPDAHARALTIDGLLLVLLGDYARAQARGEQALDEHRKLGDISGVGMSLFLLGETALQRGDLARADVVLSEAGRQLRLAGHPAQIASQLESCQVACEQGQLERARRLIAEVEALARAR
jgi:non-specific serine/threonine protein kinase